MRLYKTKHWEGLADVRCSHFVLLRLTLLIACKLLLSGTVFAQQPPPPDVFFNYPKTVLTGQQPTAEFPGSADQCSKLCAERSGCVGYDYSHSSGVCRFFGATGSARSNSNYTAGTRFCSPDTRPPTIHQSALNPNHHRRYPRIYSRLHPLASPGFPTMILGVTILMMSWEQQCGESAKIAADRQMDARHTPLTPGTRNAS